jgi:hypothetical protein
MGLESVRAQIAEVKGKIISLYKSIDNYFSESELSRVGSDILEQELLLERLEIFEIQALLVSQIESQTSDSQPKAGAKLSRRTSRCL